MEGGPVGELLSDEEGQAFNLRHPVPFGTGERSEIHGSASPSEDLHMIPCCPCQHNAQCTTTIFCTDYPPASVAYHPRRHPARTSSDRPQASSPFILIHPPTMGGSFRAKTCRRWLEHGPLKSRPSAEPFRQASPRRDSRCHQPPSSPFRSIRLASPLTPSPLTIDERDGTVLRAGSRQ